MPVKFLPGFGGEKARWGAIEGTLESQLDLRDALADKSDSAHTHDEYEEANPLLTAHLTDCDNPHSVSADQILPNQSGAAGKALSTDGSALAWTSIAPPADVFTARLTADLTFGASDALYQVLEPATSSRNVHLPTTGVARGKSFVIINSASYSSSLLLILKASGATLETISPKKIVRCFFDGSAWALESPENISLGLNSYSFNRGAAVGYSASATGSQSCALGASASASGLGASALGAGASCSGSGSNSLGPYTSVFRACELGKSVDSANVHRFFFTGHYALSTADSWTQLSNQIRILSNSAINFRLKIQALDQSNLATRAWEIKGAFRKGTGDPAFVGSGPTIADISADSGTEAWEVRAGVGAYDYLNVEVKGAAGKYINWTAASDCVETKK